MKPFATFTLLILSTTTNQGATLSSGPDAWNRGSSATTAYFGWDSFDAGAPGNPSFGGSILNDSSPDTGTALSASVVFQENTNGYGQRSGSGNIYSGFTGESLDLNVRFSSLNPTGAGSSTVFVTILGNPALDRELLPFVLSDDTNSFAPTQFLSGESAEVSGSRVWIAEWQLAGNTASEYTLSVSSNIAGGFGTDVALDSVTIDIATTPGANPLTNSSSTGSLGNVSIVPEPSSALLVTFGALLAGVRRKR